MLLEQQRKVFLERTPAVGCGLREFWGEQQQGLSRMCDTAAGNDLISLLLEAFFFLPLVLKEASTLLNSQTAAARQVF